MHAQPRWVVSSEWVHRRQWKIHGACVLWCQWIHFHVHKKCIITVKSAKCNWRFGIEQFKLQEKNGNYRCIATCVCSDTLLVLVHPKTTHVLYEQLSVVCLCTGIAYLAGPTKTNLASNDWARPVDLQQHNLGLNSAWKRAQDRSKWRKLVEMAMSCQKPQIVVFEVFWKTYKIQISHRHSQQKFKLPFSLN